MFESYRKQDFYLYQISHSYLIQIWLKKCKFKINNWQKTFWNFYNWHCMFCQCFTILQIRSFQKQILLQTSFELRPGLVSSRVSNGVSFNHHWSYLCKKVCSQEFQFNTNCIDYLVLIFTVILTSKDKQQSQKQNLFLAL